ncbi:pentapeptide repeat-containing protein, partial [bacterium]
MKTNKSIILCSLILSLSFSCTNPVNNTNSGNESTNVSSNKNTKSVSGTVQFPKSGLSVKAELTDVAKDTAVSILYPSDHQTNANKIIATGLTNTEGSFSINPESNFNPANNEIFVLEAKKRIGDVGNSVMTVRTHIKWVNNEWQSITTPGIFINSHTTSLAIIAGYNPTILTTDNTIGSILISGNNINPSTVNGITTSTINEVTTLVNTSLSYGKDPFAVIKFEDNDYYIEETANTANPSDNIRQIIQEKSCSGCDLRGMDLTNVNLSGMDLSYSDLRGLDLSNQKFINTILVGVDLRASNLPEDMTYLNLIEANLSGLDLRNVNFDNSVLTGANLTGANLS